MKELDYHPNFWSNVYWDFLDFPKKIWGLRAPPAICTGTPKMPYFRHLGGPGTDRGRGPQTTKIFWDVQEVPTDIAPKIRLVVQLLHGFL